MYCIVKSFGFGFGFAEIQKVVSVVHSSCKRGEYYELSVVPLEQFEFLMNLFIFGLFPENSEFSDFQFFVNLFIFGNSEFSDFQF